MSLPIQDGWKVRVWSIFKEEEKYAVVKIGSARKDKKTDSYVNSSWLATFVGEAFEKLQNLDIPEKGGVGIELHGATMTKEPYTDKNGETIYPKSEKFTVFNFSLIGAEDEEEEKPKKPAQKPVRKSAPPKVEVEEDDDPDEMPF